MVTNLRLLRVRKGLTLKDMAAQIGLNETWYCRMERGQNYIPPHLRQKLADFFGSEETGRPTTPPKASQILTAGAGHWSLDG